MPADEYKQKVMVPLIACIPSDVDSSHRQSLKNRIKYGAEYSLSKWLTLLFREHRETLEELIPNALELIRPIVERRNSLTHFPPPRADDPDDDKEDLLRYNFVLRVLLECCFLKLMGFSDTEITRLVGGVLGISAVLLALLRSPT